MNKTILSAMSMFQDKVASFSKEAANRNIRAFLLQKAEEWFPDKVKVIPPDVLYELLDNYAQGIMEVSDPGRNKTISDDQLITHVNKATGKPDPTLEGQLVTLFEGVLSQTPMMKQEPTDGRNALAKSLAMTLLSKGRKELPMSMSIIGDDNKIKPALFQRLLEENFVGKLQGIDHKQLAKEITDKIHSLPPGSSYISTLIYLLKGGYETESNSAHMDMLSGMGTSKEVYTTLKELLSYAWYGPINIPVDITRLEQTLTRRQAGYLYQRIGSIDHSKVYKDKDRLLGSKDRLPQYPGPREPWNSDSPLLMTRDPNNANFDIREGLHRFMSMMVQARENNQPKFTVSAYVYDRGAISKVKKSFVDIARSISLTLPSSSKGPSFEVPQSLQR